MTYRITWAHAALWVLYRLPPHTAMIVDRAVIRFAEKGEGQLEWVAPHHRLRAGVYDLILRIERESARITVLYIYRAR